MPTQKIKLASFNKEIYIDIRYPENDVLSRGLLKNNCFYEEVMLNYILKNIQTSDKKYIVDVGANIGNHTLFFSLLCNNIGIIAIEPYEKVFTILKENIRLNNLKNVMTYPVACGADHSYCDLVIPENENLSGSTSIIPGSSIPVVPLDDLVRDQPVSLIKIDVEGSEINVLKGSTKILSRIQDPPELIVEARFSDDKIQIDKYLEKFHYKNIQRIMTSTPTYHYKK
jgi:FkbM family methyltransferase